VQMEPSLAARLPLGRRGRQQTRARRGRHGLRSRDWPLSGRLRAALGALLASLVRRRAARIALLCTALALPLLAGGWMWLRTSSLVAVRSVQLSGVRGPEHAEIEAALRAAAHRMSTLAVNVGALRAAVSSYPVVRAVEAFPRFPHGLRIEVLEQLPVAALDVDGARTAAAADGVVLGAALLSGSLPSIDGSFRARPGQPLQSSFARAALAVMGLAPAPLARHVARVYSAAYGLTVQMRNGLLVYFGDAGAARAKWMSLARVLADTSSAGADYVDVRLPQRPAAGFPAGVSPPGVGAATGATGTGAAASAGGSEATIEALAEGLRSSTPGTSSTASAGTPGGAPATPSTAPSAPAAAAGEAPSATAPASTGTGG